MNTLTKGFAKRVISMLLVTIMVFSLGIVGLTSASAAASTETMTIYFTNNWDWTDVSVHYWGSDFGTAWTGAKMNKTELKDPNGKDIYSYEIPVNITGMIFNGQKEDNSGRDQSPNITSGWKDGLGYYMIWDNGNKVGTYETYVKAEITSVQASVSGVGTTADTVTFKAEYTVKNNSTTPTVKYYIKTPSDIANNVSTWTKIGETTSKTFNYKPTEAGKYQYFINVSVDGVSRSSVAYNFTVNPAVTITTPTATIDPSSIVLGNSADITVDYKVTGSTNPPTLTLYDGNKNPIASTLYKVNGKVITVTPSVENNNYEYYVKISIDGVEAWTNKVTLQCKKEFYASLSVDNKTQYIDDVFTFTIKDNSELYTGATYEVYCNDTVITPKFDGKTFTYYHKEAGTYTYYVVATVDGEPVTTNKVEITVKAKIFSVYLTAPESTMEDRAFEIKAYTEFAAGTKVTYTLTGTDGTSKVLESTVPEGGFPVVFSVTVNTVGDYTFTIYANDGVNEPVTDSVKVTITEDKGTYPIRILFKCSDTYGYLPNMSVKINGNDAVDIARQKYAAIESRPNATDTATYSWYYYEIPDVDYGTDIVFSANATRNYFYNASITIKAGQGDFVQDGTFYCYYLALENLNGGTNVLSNISALDEAHRNWTASAVNMIYDDADAHLPVGVNFAYANMNDANTDGKINVKDATYIQKSLANIVEASALSTAVSDVNGDGKVTIKDATALQKQIAGL